MGGRTIDQSPIDAAARLAFLREEVRFEIGLLHERANALIGAESFLFIAFTMALTSAREEALVLVVAPILALVGLLLAALAWPGTADSFRIIAAWDARQREVMTQDPSLQERMWRGEAQGRRRRDLDQRLSLLFARGVPAVLVVAWGALLIVAVVRLVTR